MSQSGSARTLPLFDEPPVERLAAGAGECAPLQLDAASEPSLDVPPELGRVSALAATAPVGTVVTPGMTSRSASFAPRAATQARPAPLWLAVWLPRFALEALHRSERGAPPMAVLNALSPSSPVAPPAHGQRSSKSPGAGRGLRAARSARTARAQVVICCNVQATIAGVAPGDSLGGASARCAGLRPLAREPEVEAEALAALAGWALQFTPHVSLRAGHGAALADAHGLVMEIGASLALFGGLEALRARVRDGVEALGYTACVGIAPTPSAAWLLALSRAQADITDSRRLPDALAPVPVRCIAQALAQHDQREAGACTAMSPVVQPSQSAAVDIVARCERIERRLRSLGVRSFRDCARLSPADLGRRLTPSINALIARALGHVPDPQADFEPPPEFVRRLDFADPVGDAAVVMLGFEKLLGELCGLLAGRDAGVFRLEVSLVHRLEAARAGPLHSLPPTRFVMSLLSPSRDPQHLAQLLRERIDRLSLHHPIEHIALRSVEVVALSPRSESLFGDSRRGGEGGHSVGHKDERAAELPLPQALSALVERLRARLEEAVYLPAAQADHRPERALVPLSPSVALSRRRGSSAAMGRAGRAAREAFRGAGETMARAHGLQRPLWLLTRPEPLRVLDARVLHSALRAGVIGAQSMPYALNHRGTSLALCRGPERIECGWWDGDDAARDYYLARTPAGALRWVFATRAAPDASPGSSGPCWYLHGLFA